ncbi:MAG TPA: amidohydrolase family protein [Nitrososphaerales archaeon]|nr:amidohydrolase family protein [Nitrososphaerales archaeon]
MPRTIDAHLHLSHRKDDALIPFARRNGLSYTMEELSHLMKDNGIAQGLLLSPPLTSGGMLQNEEVFRLCELSRHLLLPILTVTPTRAGVRAAVSLARKNRDKAKGFKVLLGYFRVFATDKVFDRLYRYAEEEGLPVMFHTGDTADSRGSLAHSHPLTLDALANSRPGLKIVACHFGNPWIEEVAELIYKHENFYADVSGLAVGGTSYSDKYIGWLVNKLDGAIYFAGGADKVIFGTDYPVTSHSSALELVSRLDVSSRDKKKILSGNAERVFGL